MSIYPAGTPVRWRADIPRRPGAQSGVLACDWIRFQEFPTVRWDGETDAHRVLPECITPVERASIRDAWSERRAQK